MLNLCNLRNVLSRVLDLPLLHTVVLFTPDGELVCYASEPNKTKDRVRVLVGLSTEIWQETREQNIGMVDCEVRNFALDDSQVTEWARSLGTCLCCQWKHQRKTRMTSP